MVPKTTGAICLEDHNENKSKKRSSHLKPAGRKNGESHFDTMGLK